MYRILIVEDDSDISELLRVWLSEAGYQTVEAGDGLKALEVFEAESFDLVLLDVSCPSWMALACANGYANVPACRLLC